MRQTATHGFVSYDHIEKRSVGKRAIVHLLQECIHANKCNQEQTPGGTTQNHVSTFFFRFLQ